MGSAAVMNTDAGELEQIVGAELARAQSRRWQTAIIRAARMIEIGVCMHWTGTALLVWSDSGELYQASENECQCAASKRSQPCKHRAAFKLVRRLNEIAR